MMRLVWLLIFAGWIYHRWVRRYFGSARKWEKFVRVSAEAAGRDDLAAAERALRDADALAEKKSGVLWRRRLTFTKEPLARILFKAGQLEPSAALIFDFLEQSHGAT